VAVGSTGTRGFAVDENMTVFQDTAGVQDQVPAQPLTTAGTVSPIQ
jgi:hypothetical protein